jgi:hypothetical protein
MPFVFLIIFAALAGGEAAADTVRFKADEVLVFDSDGVPLFRGNRSFVLKIAHNPTGEVVAYDAATKRVRVSKVGTELWLHCAELEPNTTSCSQASPGAQSRAGMIRGSDDSELRNLEALAQLVPSCPGDARCPRADD